MRKLFLCVLAQVMAIAAFSQVNVQLHYDLGIVHKQHTNTTNITILFFIRIYLNND